MFDRRSREDRWSSIFCCPKCHLAGVGFELMLDIARVFLSEKGVLKMVKTIFNV